MLEIRTVSHSRRKATVDVDKGLTYLGPCWNLKESDISFRRFSFSLQTLL